LIKKGCPDLVALNINEVVDSVLTTANDSFKTRDVVIERRLEASLPPVLGDRVQLQQLVSNLVNNAAEAMADVFDRPRNLVVRTEQTPGNGVSIAVEDSGRGLAGADAGRLFEPFYSTKAGGTGMGLSISRSIVEFHGGKISVVSSSRCGTVFHVELPAAQQ